MKYEIDLHSNRGFIQVFGHTDTHAPMESPMAFQVRGGLTVLERLADALDEVAARIQALDEQFHEILSARNDFELGFCVFRPGDIPVTCMVQRRAVHLMLGGRQVGSAPIVLAAFRRALGNSITREIKQS